MDMSQKTVNITQNTLVKACSGALLTAALLCVGAGTATAQVLVKNNGAVVAIKSGATVIVKTGSVDNDGLVDNAGTLIVEGDFINQDTANGGNTTGTYRIQGDWVNDGVFEADQSNVELNGANQLITGSNSTAFYNLTLLGTGIKTQTLDASVSNVLSLGDRELATDAFKMFVNNTATTAITRTTGYVSSLGNGRLSRSLAGTGVYLYPTGSSVGTTRYRPLEVTPSTGNAQTLEVRMANVNATTEGFDLATKEAELCVINPLYYHLVGHSAGATDDVALNFFYVPGTDGNFVEVAHWQNLPQWEGIGPVTAGTAPGFNTLTVGAWNAFSPEAFALTDALDADATITDATCNGQPTGSIDLDVNGGNGTYTYEWSDTSAPSSDVLANVTAGSYNVTISDASGCSATLTGLLVQQPDLLTLVASNDTTIPFDFSTTIEVLSTTGGTGAVSYEWNPSATLSSPTSASTVATPTETTAYVVTGTDDNGCTALDTVLVTVDFNLVAIPDGFTPNGDGINDVFEVHFSPAIDLVEMKIFNRWGQLVYEANKWDGTFKSTEQPMDTYIYQLVFNLPDGTTANYSGDFILIR